ncbi:DNA mismatch repair protein MutS [Haloimpatiens sp. FM7315]|uniref:DNA mismatch repair protein MutS n=1 Tax=Haloimpatiens sp. FM7315 TaxID=3298609 RepID=UPI00370C8A3D
MPLTPMMTQYMLVKEKCQDCILFFRLGDFYEMFFEDAEIASKELELVLTGRDCGLEHRAPMCGIPFHAANNYITRLVNKGFKIAICEQMEDPSLAKGLVKRDIIKIITPGTYTDSAFLKDSENNYIMSLFICNNTNKVGLCVADISTGEFNSTSFEYNLSNVMNEICKFGPKEILVSKDTSKDIIKSIKDKSNIPITNISSDDFIENHINNFEKQFKSIKLSEIDDSLMYAVNGLLNYINHTQKISLSNINELNVYSIQNYLSIDSNSRRNLELVETLRDRSKKGSLLWTIDKTSTVMGARELRKWVEHPLINKDKIEKRLNSVEELVNNLPIHEDIKYALKDIYDIERLAGKISTQSINAKEMLVLKNSIGNIPNLKQLINKLKGPLFKSMSNNLDELKDIYEIIDESISENPSLSIKEGGIIKKGYNNEIDYLKNVKSNGKEWIAKLESTEKELTGIKSLKIAYNKVFGYYIEVRKSNLELVPKERYIRKQTLANTERYITEELKEMEEKLLGAEEKLIELEYSLFVKIREHVEKQISRLKTSAKIICEIDCLSSLATVALENNYQKPLINSNNYISIKSGRHPVVEKMLSDGEFIDNDTLMDGNTNQLLLITGPNMAGKSTYMRQVALIVLMAQIGSFVPAKEADISICDKIFTRIGASDDLASGKSTFMVEMSEVSNIINNATKNSLVLMDEVGRGTSTYDGLSIAWSVIEYLCKNENLKCKTLFATHYHELTKLQGSLVGLKNYSVSVKKHGHDIVFLRKIIEGGADQSYGIEVAKLAGIPEKVLKRAREILTDLETKDKTIENKEAAISSINSKKKTSVSTTKTTNKEVNAIQLDFSYVEKENIIKNLKDIDILNLTPMEGFNKLYEIIKKAKSIM